MSKIQWTDRTWNPVRGCSLVSTGCANCYAMKQAHRFSGKGKPYEGLTEIGPFGPRWNGKIRLIPDALKEPLHWKKPQRVFVNSMSDLFHEDVPREFLKAVMGVTMDCPQHAFQILTKRPQRMREVVTELNGFPSNVWLGVSVENQTTADERIPILLETPAAVRFISAEPLLGPIDLLNLRDGTFNALDGIDFELIGGDQPEQLSWVIVGGESGPGARPCDLGWIRSIKEQCQAAKVPVFVKQLGRIPLFDRDESVRHLKDKKGGDMAEWPEDLRVREFPMESEAS